MIKNLGKKLVCGMIFAVLASSCFYIMAMESDQVGSDTSFVGEVETAHKTPLHEALASAIARRAFFSHYEFIDEFKSHINEPDVDGRTPLYMAVLLRDRALVSKLMDAGANPYTYNSDRSMDCPITYVIRAIRVCDGIGDRGRISKQDLMDILGILLRGYPDVKQDLRDGSTVLGYARAQDSKSSVDFIIDLAKKGSANRPDEDGVRPLYRAISDRNWSDVLQLMENGADPYLPNAIEGRADCPISIFIDSSSTFEIGKNERIELQDILKALFKGGFTLPDTRLPNGDTVFDYALKNGSFAVLKWLIKNKQYFMGDGADIAPMALILASQSKVDPEAKVTFLSDYTNENGNTDASKVFMHSILQDRWRSLSTKEQFDELIAQLTERNPNLADELRKIWY